MHNEKLIKAVCRLVLEQNAECAKMVLDELELKSDQQCVAHSKETALFKLIHSLNGLYDGYRYLVEPSISEAARFFTSKDSFVVRLP